MVDKLELKPILNDLKRFEKADAQKNSARELREGGGAFASLYVLLRTSLKVNLPETSNQYVEPDEECKDDERPEIEQRGKGKRTPKQVQRVGFTNGEGLSSPVTEGSQHSTTTMGSCHHDDIF